MGLSDGGGQGIRYGGLSGGYITMNVQAVVLHLEPAPEPLLLLRAVRIGGPLYIAGLANKEVPVLASLEPL